MNKILVTGAIGAVELAAAGAEVFQGDMACTVDLISVVQGCYSVFGVTNFRENVDTEFQPGKNLLDAASHSSQARFFSYLTESV